MWLSPNQITRKLLRKERQERNLAAKLEKHNKAEAASACAPASLITLARLQDPTLSPAGFEIRVTRTVAGTAEPLDLAAAQDRHNTRAVEQLAGLRFRQLQELRYRLNRQSWVRQQNLRHSIAQNAQAQMHTAGSSDILNQRLLLTRPWH